jgi:8-oxo-dGDP phosphatase
MPDAPIPGGRGAAELRDEPVDVRIVDSDLVYEGRVWDVRSDTVRYGDADIVRQYVDHPGAAAIVAVDDRERVLLIQQYRHPIRRRDWEVPAGLLDVAGEAPMEAARRELVEEADLEASDWSPLVSVFTTPGGNDEVVHLFLARGLSPVPQRFDREDEEADIRVEWVPLAEAVDAVIAGRMRNGILAIGVLAAAERLRREAAAAPA